MLAHPAKRGPTFIVNMSQGIYVTLNAHAKAARSWAAAWIYPVSLFGLRTSSRILFQTELPGDPPNQNAGTKAQIDGSLP